MSEQVKTQAVQREPLLERFANLVGLDYQRATVVLMQTVMPSKGPEPSKAEVAAFLAVATQYGLNPLRKEIYAFPSGGKIVPMVSIDGWLKMANDHKAFDGLEFEDILNGADLLAIKCRVFRKDRSHAIEAIEYMRECARNTDPWKTWPRRMLRHKATVQALRLAFGFSGVYDEDEAERIAQATSAERKRPISQEMAEAVADMTAPREIVLEPEPKQSKVKTKMTEQRSLSEPSPEAVAAFGAPLDRPLVQLEDEDPPLGDDAEGGMFE